LTLSAAATILFAAYGVTDPRNAGHLRRSVPSAGGLYPLDWYLASLTVEDLPRGLYHYEPSTHSLEVVSLQDVLPALEQAILTRELLRRAAAVFILTALFERSRRKYGLRAYRFVLLEAGHSMQNVLLMATCLGIDATPIGGYLDAEFDRLLRVNGVDETTLYVAAAG
jgi:SagB-type dehydrogenase family enzyme